MSALAAAASEQPFPEAWAAAASDSERIELFAGVPSKFHSNQVTFSKDELEEMQTSNVDADSGAASESTDAASQDNDVDYDPPEVNERNTEVESNQ